MRVIAGKYKKRQLKIPKSNLTRPTTDKNKENLFNMIGPYFDGGTVLDLFGGSGGLGIEALSRGCEYLYSVDHQYEAFKTIKDNLSLLKIDNAKALKMDYKKALHYLKEHHVIFDYVFLDPPYGKNLVDDILQYLVVHKMLNDHACIVVEELKEVQFQKINDLELIKRKEYGITALNVFEFHRRNYGKDSSL
ncbi:MAG: 16S rRNA (guanine(966)-N(2))-methyltransferase RsmD [Faecalibacillus sp.]